MIGNDLLAKFAHIINAFQVICSVWCVNTGRLMHFLNTVLEMVYSWLVGGWLLNDIWTVFQTLDKFNFIEVNTSRYVFQSIITMHNMTAEMFLHNAVQTQAWHILFYLVSIHSLLIYSRLPFGSGHSASLPLYLCFSSILITCFYWF